MKLKILILGLITSIFILKTVNAQDVASNLSSSFGVSIEVDVDNYNPYLKTEVIYTIRIIDTVGIITGQSFPPQDNGYFVAKISDKPKITRNSTKGKGQNIVEQKFALIPNKTGEITILPARFEGVISHNKMRINLVSPEIIINVKPKPQQALKKDIPLFKRLEVIDSWEQTPPQFFKNQPANRNITLIALGTIAEELPKEIDITKTSNVTIQQTSSTIRTSSFNDELMAIKEFVYSYFPSSLGEINLPNSYIAFWNIKNNQIEENIIKGGKFQVKEAVSSYQENFNTDIFASIDVDNKTPYLQSQIILSLKIFDALGINRRNVELPKLDDFITYPLESVFNYTQNISGKDYLVSENRYALFPQKSGIINISSIKITAVTEAKEIINLNTNQISINVLPKPDNFNAKNWLPAQNFEILSGWDSSISEIETGKALRQTIKLKAVGLASEQLPEIEIPVIDNIKTYVSHNQNHNEIVRNGLIGIKSKTIIYLPYEAGKATIPSFAIEWFDTKTKEIKTQKILSKDLIVSKKQNIIKKTDVLYDKAPNVYLFISSFIILVMFLFLFFIKKIKSRNKNIAIIKLWQACQDNNAKNTYKALVEWGAGVWQDHPPNNPFDIAERADNTEFAEQITILIDCAYGGDYEWDGRSFFKIFKATTKQIKLKAMIKKDHNDLPKLYPS